MRLSHWLGLVALVTGIGCLQVSQRTAIMLGGYGVGQRMSRVHAQETDVSWLQANVVGLASPTHLARVAQEKRLNLVARSTVSRNPLPQAAAQARTAPAAQPIQLAADETLD
jgi:hypothetical protein